MEKRNYMMENELTPIFEQVDILLEEIESNKYTYEEARTKCDEIYALIPATYLVDFVALNKAMDNTYPGVSDDSFKRTYKIPVGNIPQEEIESYIQKIASWIKRK